MVVSKKKKREITSVSKSKLFKRYFTIIVVIILISLFILGVSLLLLVSNYWWQEKFDLLQSNSKTISTVVSSLSIFDDPDDESYRRAGETLSLFSTAAICDFFICDMEGNVVVCKETTVRGDVQKCEKHKDIVIKKEFINRAASVAYSDYTDLGGTFPYSNFVVGFPVKADDGSTVGIVFAIEDAVSSLLPYVESITKIFLISALAALVIAFIASYVFSYGVAKPLSEMIEATRHFAKGEFTHRVAEKQKKGEMRELAMSLNKMADDLAVEDKSKKSFVANVSHELKTPMTTIGGFIDGILDGTIPPEKQKEYLQTVSVEVKRLSRLVVAMLNLSKIESGEISLRPVRYDLSSQMFETMLSFERVIEKSGISVEGFENMQGVTVCADKDLLHQVIYNLMDNAVKFTPDGGTITLSAENRDGGTTVHIRNSGAGVSEEEISRIFERFYKVDKSRSYDTKGVGLGLYIVKTIVHMHSGHISASSELGKYTEFTFFIPDTSDEKPPLD